VREGLDADFTIVPRIEKIEKVSHFLGIFGLLRVGIRMMLG
jgi:hypothetical protein